MESPCQDELAVPLRHYVSKAIRLRSNSAAPAVVTRHEEEAVASASSTSCHSGSAEKGIARSLAPSPVASAEAPLVSTLPRPQASDEKDTPTCVQHPPCPGDIVLVGRRGSIGQSSSSACTAIVTKIHERHCTAVMLDDRLRGTGECWPFFEDIVIQNSWRVGTRVTVTGLRSAAMQHLNGVAGSIIRHPSQGHPVFVTKPSVPEPVLTFCVRLNVPVGNKRTVMLEPKYLVTEEEFLSQVTENLSATLTFLGAKCDEPLSPLPSDVFCNPRITMPRCSPSRSPRVAS